MLLYRGTRDSFSAKSFHFKCNGKTPTLTIYQVKESNFIFGGYTNVKWDSSNEFKSDPNAYIFTINGGGTDQDLSGIGSKLFWGWAPVYVEGAGRRFFPLYQ